MEVPYRDWYPAESLSLRVLNVVEVMRRIPSVTISSSVNSRAKQRQGKRSGPARGPGNRRGVGLEDL